MKTPSSAVFDLLNVPKEAALEFFGAFARFEYALKRAGYVRGVRHIAFQPSATA